MPIIDDESFIAEYKANNISVVDLCRKYGIPYSGVYYRLKKYNVPARSLYRHGRKASSAVERETAVSEYTAGATTTELADKYGVHISTVNNWVRAAGVPRRPAGTRKGALATKRDAMKIRQEYEAGASSKQLANKYHVGDTAIQNWVKLAGGTMRQQIRVPFPYSECYATDSGYLERALHADYWLASAGVARGGRADGVKMLEHRRVMAEYIGRPLTRKETVHHIDGNRMNNNLDNLQLRQGQHGPHQAWKCRSCGGVDIEAVPLA